MRRLFSTVLLIGVTALASLVLACGEEEPAPTSSASGDAQTLGGGGDAGGSGVFRRLWQEPPTLDPHEAGDTTSAGIIVEVFSGLVALNTSLQVVPELASRWDVSEDGKTYTFHLRRTPGSTTASPSPRRT